jgi:hypothetical protein
LGDLGAKEVNSFGGEVLKLWGEMYPGANLRNPFLAQTRGGFLRTSEA